MFISGSSAARPAWSWPKFGTRRAQKVRDVMRAKAWTYDTPAGVWRIESRGDEWFVRFGSREMGPFLSLYQALDWVGAGASAVEGGPVGLPLDVGLWQPEFEHKLN